MNLRFMMTTTTHIHVFCRIRSSTQRSLGADQAEDSKPRGDRAEGRLHVGGLKVAMGRGENHRCVGGPGAR
jgi:hypothetical protein